MYAVEPIDVAAGAWAEAVVTAAAAPLVVATAATAAAADVWGTALTRSLDVVEPSGAWPQPGMTRWQPVPLLWGFWWDRSNGAADAGHGEGKSAEVIDFSSAYAVYRTAGGHAAAQILRSRDN
jgi:hypothetical protein